MLPMKRRPVHPGEMLREDFLPDYKLTAADFAKAIGVSRRTVNELLRERRGVTPRMTLFLSRFFGNDAEFWLNAQRNVDLWDALQENRKKIGRIIPVKQLCTCKGKDPGNRLARECAKLDPREEKAMAEEGMRTLPRTDKPRQGWAKRFLDAIRKERAAEYLEKRAAKGSRRGFERAMKKVRDVKPARKDAL
jgi:addiction module HigA family antidote